MLQKSNTRGISACQSVCAASGLANRWAEVRIKSDSSGYEAEYYHEELLPSGNFIAECS